MILSLKAPFWIIFSIFFLFSCTHYMKKNMSHSNYSFVYEDNELSSLNRIIRDLSFFPINRLRFRFSELENIKAIVIFMREKDCPISEKYGPRIARFERKYSKKGIKFIYNYVGQVKRIESAKNDLKKFGFKAPYVIDSKKTLVTALNAKTTGDVFILTPQRRVIYRGPLDDQYHLLRSAPKPKNHYVLNILDAIISGKSIDPKEMPAPGCIIDRPIIKKKFFGVM